MHYLGTKYGVGHMGESLDRRPPRTQAEIWADIERKDKIKVVHVAEQITRAAVEVTLPPTINTETNSNS